MGIDDKAIDDLVSAYRDRLEHEKYEGFFAEINASQGERTRGIFRGKHELFFDEPEYVRVSDGDLHPCPHDYLLATVGGCQIEILKQCLEKSRIEGYEIDLEIRSKKAREGVSEERGFIISDLHTTVTVSVPDEFVTRARRCADTFEDYCSISQSVRVGVDIETEAEVVSDAD
ncbi:MAG: OsmC family protein [Halobacteriales archaeon]|nr:OsmC family protein [Halobacteriales archaeon]